MHGLTDGPCVFVYILIKMGLTVKTNNYYRGMMQVKLAASTEGSCSSFNAYNPENKKWISLCQL